ncbi:MAG: DUF2851 family protein [Cyclobacteriaceae bacterium]|nr:DUF2851 family protein [Cyclobacteriaceae bacterium]
MQETFLHFIWQYQYFEKKDLITSSGTAINIVFPGHSNNDAGPDFSDAQITIGDIKWAGNVEIHVKSSFWYAHKHDKDKSYDNVVLHVVWDYDKPVFRTDGSEIPTLELKNRIDPQLLENSNRLVINSDPIPCSNQLTCIDDLVKLSMMDRVLMQRLERKALEVMEIFEHANNNWEECAYQLLCKNFGFKTNSQPFEQLAKSISINVLRKHSNSILQIEAFLFGQAGFLDKINSDYQQELEYEYRFLSHKYKLETKKINKELWKFARLRPANFPTIRLAQLSAIIKRTTNLFTSLIELRNYKEVEKLLKVNLSTYWHNHYQFGEKSENKVATIGKSSIENIVINTVAPLLVAYGKSIDKQELVDKAISLLESTPPEKNNITRKWDILGENATSAFDSQAQIELFNNHCKKKRCLQCAVGLQILKPNFMEVK